MIEFSLRSYRLWSRSFNQEFVEKRRAEVETKIFNHKSNQQATGEQLSGKGNFDDIYNLKKIDYSSSSE